jgi:hypothetical protein
VTRWRSARALWIAGALIVLLGALWVQPDGAHGAPTVTTISSTTGALNSIDVHVSKGTPSTLNSQYIGFKIVNDATIRTDLWVQLDTFSNTNVALAPGENGIAHPGRLNGSATTHAYFLLKGTLPVGGTTTFNVRLYNGPPNAGGTLISTSEATATVRETTNASANKVTSGFVSPAAPTLGATFTVVINGLTGTMATSGTNPSPSAIFSPAFAGAWKPSTFELVGTRITFPEHRKSGSTQVSETFTNQLAFTPVSSNQDPAKNQIGRARQPYTATYTFRAVDSSEEETRVTPVAHIKSGGIMKYTNAGSLGNIAPITRVTNSFVIDARVSPALSQTGLLTYTLTLSAVSEDLFYNGLALPEVEVAVINDDFPAQVPGWIQITD